MSGCEVIVAQNAGFCPGVRRADEALRERLAHKRTGERIFTLGDLIHNEDYLEEMRARGVRTIGCEALARIADEASAQAPVTVLVRAHGIPITVRRDLERFAAQNEHFSYLDCTCPFVTKIHRIASEYSAGDAAGKYLFLCIGAKEHPEVEGFMSCFEGTGAVFADDEELERALAGGFLVENAGKTPILVAQTTQNVAKWKKSQKVLQRYCTNALFFDTICNVTDLRQAEARTLAASCDGMVVIGGTESSNTAKLESVCRALCPDTLRVTGQAQLWRVEPFAMTHRKVGIVAGASTPTDIIKEVHRIMSENFAEMLNENLKTLNTGDIVTGTVTRVTDTELQLDLGTAVTGYIKAERATNDPSVKLTEAYKIGDQVEAKVVRVSDIEGVAELDKTRVDSSKNWDKIVAAKENDEILEAPVADVVKGGAIVFVYGNRVFIPASQSGVPKDGDLAPLKGTTVKFKIIETKEPGHKAIGSIRVVLRAERRAKEEIFWNEIEEGKVYTGVVKSMTSYGAFVDLGGVDGMVHTTELSWKHIKTPAEVVAIGDVITVFVKSFDKEKKRISLGYKTEETNPWVIFTAQNAVGDVVSVKIVSLTPFGAFAEIIEGVDGLIHISQIAMTRIGKPADVLEVGQVVDAKIIEIDNEKKKVSLSIRALLEEVAAEAEAMPEDAGEYAAVEETPAE